MWSDVNQIDYRWFLFGQQFPLQPGSVWSGTDIFWFLCGKKKKLISRWFSFLTCVMNSAMDSTTLLVGASLGTCAFNKALSRIRHSPSLPLGFSPHIPSQPFHPLSSSMAATRPNRPPCRTVLISSACTCSLMTFSALPLQSRWRIS